MKKLTLSTLFLLIIFFVVGQKQIKIFYNNEGVVVDNEKDAHYSQVITFNKNNKSGSIKGIYTNGQSQYIGNFLLTEVPNLRYLNDGKCTWYYKNGKISRISSYSNGVEIGITKYYDESGRLTAEVPYSNGNLDSLNSKYYEYDESGNLVTILKGFYNEEQNPTGELSIYINGKVSGIVYLRNGNLQTSYWFVSDPNSNKTIATYSNNFSAEEASDLLEYKSNDDVHIKVDNNELTFTFLNDLTISRAILPTPLNLNKHNFVISATIDGKSTAVLQGITFGYLDEANYSAIHVIPKANVMLYERVVDNIDEGNFAIKDIKYRDNLSNYIQVKKESSKIKLIFNGVILSEIDDYEFSGNNIGIYGGSGRAKEIAYFKNFEAKITAINSAEIKLKKVGSVYSIPVELNGVLKIDFIFDSGASDVSISPDVALTLLKTGTIKNEDWLEGAYYKFADGSTAKSRRFRLKSLKIGNKIVSDVVCSISNSVEAPMLLGQSILSKLGKYTFDYKKGILAVE